jgi:hypothetical protein
MVLQGLKPRIFDQLNKYAGQWVAEVPAILWSLRTTPNRSIGFTPFFLAYGAKAVIPSDIDHGAPRVKAFDRDRATEAQQDAVDLLEEARERTVICSTRYQQTLCMYHERKIRGRILEVGDLMLRRTQSTKEKQKLSQPCEGPYMVTEVIRPGA